MILVLNLNASIDKRYMLDDFVPGTVMRAPSVSNTAGGKGIHVARVASLLGEETLTTGFLGGKTGEFIEERLRRVGLPGDFVKVEGATRSCLAFLTRDGGQTEVLEPGPEISCEELAAFREKYTALLTRADVVAASGSLPCGVPTGFYAVLIAKARAAGVPFLLDTSGKPPAARPTPPRRRAASCVRTLSARSCRKSRLLLSLFDIPHFYISLSRKLPGCDCQAVFACGKRNRRTRDACGVRAVSYGAHGRLLRTR